MSRATGDYNFPNSFECRTARPLDARMATPSLSHLSDGSIPFTYPGMVVAVTADATPSNNGLYICSANDGDSASDWTRVGTTYSVYGSDTDYGYGLVPTSASSDGSGTGFLKEDGSWATPTGTTYTTFTS